MMMQKKLMQVTLHIRFCLLAETPARNCFYAFHLTQSSIDKIINPIMPSTIEDTEIHQIVQRVVNNVLGSSERAPVQSAGKKIVAIGADHGGFELKETLKNDLNSMGFDVMDVGTVSKESVDYPDFAHAVAQSVGTGKAWRGIMIDGAGIGSCIVANKVPGVRA